MPGRWKKVNADLNVDNVASRIANGEKCFFPPLNSRMRFVPYVDFGTENVVRVGLKPIGRHQVKVKFQVAIMNSAADHPFNHSRDDYVEYPHVVPLTPREGVRLRDYPFNGSTWIEPDTISIYLMSRYFDEDAEGADDADDTEDLEDYDIEESPYKSKFANDLVELADDTPFSDLKIVVGEGDRQRTFKTHRCFLVKRSEYFRGLFGSGMRDSCQDQLRYEDVDPDAFGHFLKYVYTAVFPRTLPHEELMKLWAVASRFVAPDLDYLLKEYFFQSLWDRNSIGNMLETLSFTYSFMPHLLEFCLLRVRGSLRLARATEEWQEMERDQPDLVALVLESDSPSSSSSSATSVFLTPTSPSPSE